jgi:2',3'-cyclic-nucleotide 2'-phosphodiesterase (5'-nucleotidase family)
MAKKAADTTQQGTDQAAEAISGVNSSLMKAFDQNRTIVQQLMRAMQEESLRFVSLRFEHTTRAIERSRDMQGLSGLITLQQDWLMDAARDFAEFNKRFGEVLHEVAEHGVDNMNEVAADTARTQKSALGERAAA